MSLTVHALPTPDPAVAGRSRGRLTLWLVLLACAAPVIASYLMYYVVRPQARTNYAQFVQPEVALPGDLPLTDLSGQPVPPQRLHGQWLLVVVAPSSCGAACEGLLYEQRQLREMLGREKDRLDRVWLVTDNGPVSPALQQAMASGAAGWVLRVPAERLATWLQPEPGRSLSDHLYLVDPMGRWMMRSPPQPDPMRLKKDLERLLRASAFWDRAGRGT